MATFVKLPLPPSLADIDIYDYRITLFNREYKVTFEFNNVDSFWYLTLEDVLLNKQLVSKTKLVKDAIPYRGPAFYLYVQSFNVHYNKAMLGVTLRAISYEAAAGSFTSVF